MFSINQAEFLFIPGVFKSRVLKPKPQAEPPPPPKKQPPTVPTLFTSWEYWPKSTDKNCLTCDKKINTKPYFEPQAIEPQGNGTLSVIAEGTFCSVTCVTKHINQTKNLADRLNKLAMLNFVLQL